MVWNILIRLVAVSLFISAMTGCAGLPSDYHRIESRAFQNTETTKLGREIQKDIQNRAGHSGFYPLVDGHDALLARLALIDQAEVSIDAQYYLFHSDLVGSLFMHHLLMAADRGVRIRLLIDDLASAKADKSIAIANSHPNMEIRLFNPVIARGLWRPVQFLTDFSRINRRMHNKAFIVDNQVAIIGGRNIGDEYYKASAVEFSDLDVIQVGAVVPDISGVFDQFWNSTISFPAEAIVNNRISKDDLGSFKHQLKLETSSDSAQVYGSHLKSAPIIEKLEKGELELFWGDAQVYADQPEKLLLPLSDKNTHLTPQLKPLIESAKTEFVMFSPYFVPGNDGVAFLQRLVDRGVSVTVVTNSLASTDVAIVHAGYSRYREKLLKAGVRLIEMKPIQKRPGRSLSGSKRASLHAKTYIVDRHLMFVGSLNLDPRSVLLNTELGVVYDSKALAEMLLSELSSERKREGVWELKLTDRGIEWFNCHRLCVPVATRDPDTSFLTRLGIAIMSVLPIEQQL